MMPLNTDEPLIALIDLDGTITEWMEWKPELGCFGEIKPIAKQTIQQMKEDGWEIIIYTSRHWLERDHIIAYLEANDVPVDSVICGKPLGLIYIDVGHRANWNTVRNELGYGETDCGFC